MTPFADTLRSWIPFFAFLLLPCVAVTGVILLRPFLSRRFQEGSAFRSLIPVALVFLGVISGILAFDILRPEFSFTNSNSRILTTTEDRVFVIGEVKIPRARSGPVRLSAIECSSGNRIYSIPFAEDQPSHITEDMLYDTYLSWSANSRTYGISIFRLSDGVQIARIDEGTIRERDPDARKVGVADFSLLENLQVAVQRKDGSRFLFDPAPDVSHRERMTHRLYQNESIDAKGTNFSVAGDRRKSMWINGKPALPDRFFLDGFFLGARENTAVVFAYDSTDHQSYQVSGITNTGSIVWNLTSEKVDHPMIDSTLCGTVLILTGMGRATGVDALSGKILWQRGI